MTNFFLPVWIDEIWAKSPEEEGRAGESLSGHTWQVLERLSELIEMRPNLPEQLEFTGLWHSLFWACLLHDFGKSARGFQKWLRGGLRWSHRHEVLSLAFMYWLEGTFSNDEFLCTVTTIAYHHRDSSEISLQYSGLENYTLSSLVDEVEIDTLNGLWRWLTECLPTWIMHLNFSTAGVRPPEIISLNKALDEFYASGPNYIRGCLRKIQRWERENKRIKNETLNLVTLVLRGHINLCDYTASAHTGPFLQSPLQRPEMVLKQWGLTKSKLYPHQKACLGVKGSVVLVSPTGSGKTESALLWACSQANGEKPPPRLLYTLPYQASMNAMYDRLNAKSFPGYVGLEHSHSTLALYRRFLDDSYDRQQALRLARWTKNLSRLHYFPIRVLSPYQMLKGTYRLKGYEALLTDFFNAAFIFDEVHAYEVERLAAILATVKYLREKFGAVFFIMSATLPDLLLNRLCEVLGSNAVIKATQDVFSSFQRHKLLVQNGDLLQDRWITIIVGDVTNGCSVLVCCNTVKRAQQAYTELIQRLKGRAEVILLHGRFNSRDRLFKEKQVQSASGSHSDGRRPVVLVATQVVEVSLDIDLDVIYTDPAPLEALIQRFGRVNRRRLKKWSPVNVFCDPSDGQKIYDVDLVRKSLDILKKNSDMMIDESGVSTWLNTIYQGEIAERWDKKYEESYESFEAVCLGTLRPFETNESLEEMFYRAFDSIEVLPACLNVEYQALLTENPLEASQLLVPISWGQFCNFRRKGMVEESRYGWPKVIDIPYDCEMGLGNVNNSV